jgi:protein O-GlcNAc transferase
VYSTALRSAKNLYQQGRLDQAAMLLSQTLKQEPGNTDAMQLLGTIRYQLGHEEEGLGMVERAISINPANADAWNSLGLMRYLAGENESALAAFTGATAADPNHGEAWMNQGFMLQELGRQAEAVPFLERAIGVGYTSPNVYFFLGNALAASGHHAWAIEQYNRCVEMAPEYGDAWNNRGNSLSALGRSVEAVTSLEKALRLSPENPHTPVNLASAMLAAGEPERAMVAIDAALDKVRTSEGLHMRSDILIDLDRFDEATKALEDAVDIASTDIGSHRALSRIYQRQAYWAKSLQILDRAVDPASQVLRAVTLPVMLESTEQIEVARTHLRDSVTLIRASNIVLVDPLREVGQTTFYLAYHGVGERDLQRQVAEMYRQVCPALATEAGHTPGKGSRIRLGIISAFLHGHTIGKLFGGLFERLDRNRFEVVFIQSGKHDALSERIAQAADKHVLLPTSLFDAFDLVAKERLDVLLYPDVGMNPLTYFLAFCRLAPVQCVMWGHPMTTGSLEMDFFISSEHLETSTGQAEYTEKLVRLPSLTTHFKRPVLPEPATRSEFGLPEDAKLYSCLQTLFKFHPDFDRVLADILNRDENGLLVLIAPKIRHWQEVLVDRWRRNYPVLAERSVFLEPMSLERFLALATLSDAVLDPIQYGGGNSSLECFAVGAPVVTLPQSLLRNRITYAAYKEIGFDDLIAADENEYTELAIRLANDPAWQHSMRRAVDDHCAPLFENGAALRELEAFLANARV